MKYEIWLYLSLFLSILTSAFGVIADVDINSNFKIRCLNHGDFEILETANAFLTLKAE